ncbi:MAG: hypothetical protein PVJ21_11775 [Anaerolineales bacterium]|jgi:hypothetical protein
MKIIKNEKLINRNAKIGQYTSLGALVVLGIGMYISFTQPELFVWALVALLIGFTLTQIGMYFGNRWGRSPRPDEKLDTGLKGLTKDYSIYHWTTPVAHLLAGPAGIWVLIPYHQRGQVTYKKNRWRMSGGGFLQNYMRLFGQEGIGRPDLEAESEIESIKKALAKELGDDEIPKINAALVFTNEEAEIEVEDAPMPAIPIKKLKDFVRNKAKEKPITPQELEKVKAALPE